MAKRKRKSLTPSQKAARDEQKQARVEEAFKSVANMFRSGSLPEAIAKTWIAQKKTIPFQEWSPRNQLITVAAHVQRGWDLDDLDARTYAAWRTVGRQVIKGAKGFDILRPVKVYEKDKDGNFALDENGSKKVAFITYSPIREFPLCLTEVADEEKWEKELKKITYSPPKSPPFFEVAQRFGIRVKYGPGNDDLDGWGWYSSKSGHIQLYTYCPGTFLHELAHAADDKLQGGILPGQHADQEIVAEGVAAVIAVLLKDEHPELQGRLQHSRDYIEAYARRTGIKEAHTAFVHLSERILDVVSVIMDPSLIEEEETSERAAQVLLAA